MQDVFVDYEGDWAVVTAGLQRYIGRIVDHGESNEYKLSPVFDYISELQQVDERGNMGRVVLLTPIDLCVTFESVLTVFAHTVMRFSEMDSKDRREYEKVVHQGVAMSLAARAKKSGIELASNIPPQQNGGIILK